MAISLSPSLLSLPLSPLPLFSSLSLSPSLFPPLHTHPHTQGALAQLIQYYHRFQKVLSQPPFKPLPIRGELINIHHLMVEVKKHRTTF